MGERNPKKKSKPKPAPERVSQAEFARRKGVTRAAVTYAIQSGRIKLEDDQKILVEQALLDWEENSDVTKQRTPPSENYNDAKTRMVIAEADLAELELQEKLGSIVSIDEVRQALAAMVKTTRDRILGTARRLAPLLVGKQNEREVADKIHHELEDALRSLSEEHVTKRN